MTANDSVPVGKGKTVWGSVLLGISVMLHFVLQVVPELAGFEWVATLIDGILASAGITLTGIGLRHALEKVKVETKSTGVMVEQALAEIDSRAASAEPSNKNRR